MTLFFDDKYGAPESANPIIKKLWRKILKKVKAQYPLTNYLLLAESRRAHVTPEEMRYMIAHGIYVEERRKIGDKWRREYEQEEVSETLEDIAENEDKNED